MHHARHYVNLPVSPVSLSELIFHIFHRRNRVSLVRVPLPPPVLSPLFEFVLHVIHRSDIPASPVVPFCSIDIGFTIKWQQVVFPDRRKLTTWVVPQHQILKISKTCRATHSILSLVGNAFIEVVLMMLGIGIIQAYHGSNE